MGTFRFIVAWAFTLTLFQCLSGYCQAGTFNALQDFSSVQGGTNGAWFYQEYNGSTFSNLVFSASGNAFTGNQPSWIGAANTALPILFNDSATLDGLVFHPGVPADGPQPSRHDVVLRWTAPQAGTYDIDGFIRGDSRFGVGGNGFQFSIFQESHMLFNLDIAFNDKANHAVTLSGLQVSANESITFRVYDKGNNEFDPGVYNFTISPVPEPTSLSLFALGGVGLAGCAWCRRGRIA